MEKEFNYLLRIDLKLLSVAHYWHLSDESYHNFNKQTALGLFETVYFFTEQGLNNHLLDKEQCKRAKEIEEREAG